MDKIEMYIMIGLAFLILLSIWAMCRAASDADNITEEWNKNWIGQKFDKEGSND